jgi:hypothetical protein
LMTISMPPSPVASGAAISSAVRYWLDTLPDSWTCGCVRVWFRGVRLACGWAQEESAGQECVLDGGCHAPTHLARGQAGGVDRDGRAAGAHRALGIHTQLHQAVHKVRNGSLTHARHAVQHKAATPRCRDRGGERPHRRAGVTQEQLGSLVVSAVGVRCEV